jgi:hypothetical protein
VGALSRNFHWRTTESTALVLFFREFIGMKAAYLVRIGHTTADACRTLSELVAVISFNWLRPWESV